jgi:1-phosphofructokinase
MIYTLTTAPALDYYMEIPALTENAVNRAVKTRTEVGGKGINVSLVLAELGVKNTAIVALGGFTGEEIKGRLEAAKLHTIPIKTDNDSRINVKFPFAEVNAFAPALSEAAFEKLFAVIGELCDSDTLIISGGVPDGLKLSDIRTRVGGRLICDVSGTAIEEAIESKPFLMKPNHHEICAFYNAPDTDDLSVIEALARRMQKGGVRNVAVSMGGRGALLVTEEGECLYKAAFEGTPVNTVGAGDSFLAGFVAGLTFSDGDIKNALNLAGAAGGAAAFSQNLPKRSEIERLYNLK